MPYSLIQSATYWLGLGFALLPCQPGSKNLVAGFGPYRNHIRDAAGAWRWFGERRCNLAVVCGVGALVVADFDDVAAFESWQASAPAGLKTRIEISARGAHVFFCTAGTIPSYAQAGALEIKSSGAVLVAPSVHPSGRPYEVLSDSEPAWLDDPASVFHLLSKPQQPSERAPLERGRLSVERAAAGSLVSRIKQSVSIVEVAARLTLLKRSDAGGRWLLGYCPFHDDKHPSFWVDSERGLWGCYSPHCPTAKHGAKAHDVINLVAWAEHVSEGQAIRLLAERLEGRP